MTNPLFESGLLEQPLLRICSDELLCPLGQPVGQIRCHRPSPGWSWCFPTVWTIHEWFEEPLVFSIRRDWTVVPRWEVRDAENRTIGWVGRRLALDRFEDVLFRVSPQGLFRSPEGIDLGAFTDSILRFGPLTAGQPFVRMLLLAQVICDAVLRRQA